VSAPGTASVGSGADDVVPAPDRPPVAGRVSAGSRPVTEAGTTEAGTTEPPATALPMPPQSATPQPNTAQPNTAQPNTAQPNTAQPTTVEPTTVEPTTAQSTTAQPTIAQPTGSAQQPPRYGLEVFLVLGLSLGKSGLDALVSLIDRLTQPTSLGSQTAVLNGTYVQDREWLDFIYQVVGLAEGFVAPALALFLLARSPALRGFGIGFDRLRLGREALQGAGFAALIGIPGLGLIYTAHRFGFNTQLVASGLPDVWYRIPVLVTSALQNATSEEIIVMGYLLTRLAQLGWTRERSILAAALLRGSYHLYQGFGGFLGNAVMGLVFGWWFTRTKRVLPLLIAHTILDTFSFVGYVYLSPHISWI
jgi:membrane protease YdiL (CAAX protease family)